MYIDRNMEVGAAKKFLDFSWTKKLDDKSLVSVYLSASTIMRHPLQNTHPAIYATSHSAIKHSCNSRT